MASGVLSYSGVRRGGLWVMTVFSCQCRSALTWVYPYCLAHHFALQVSLETTDPTYPSTRRPITERGRRQQELSMQRLHLISHSEPHFVLFFFFLVLNSIHWPSPWLVLCLLLLTFIFQIFRPIKLSFLDTTGFCVASLFPCMPGCNSYVLMHLIDIGSTQ